jgi:transcription antitermination factor NusG
VVPSARISDNAASDNIMHQSEYVGNDLDAPWYVIRVKANSERKVAQGLTNRDVAVFLPLQKRLSKRKTLGLIEVPLFPGYVFAQFERRESLLVVSCPGVVQVLCRGSVPEPVDPAEMYSLLVLSRTARSLSLLPTFTTGQKVRITGGPLADVEGIVLRDNGRQRLILSVSLLRRSVVAEIDREWLEDVNPCVHVTPWMATGT